MTSLSINQSLAAARTWQTAGTVKTLIIYSAAPLQLPLDGEAKLLTGPTFWKLWNFAAFPSRIFLNVRNLWMCRVGTALFLRFCPLHFARHPALGLGGNEFLNGFSKYFSAYLKAKVIYVTVNPSFRKSDDSRAGVGMSRQGLKNMQKLRQKIFEDHLRPPPANCFDKQTNLTDHKTILRRHLISQYWNMNPLSCIWGKCPIFFGRKQLSGYSCQVFPLYRPYFWLCEVQSIWLPFVKMSPKLCSPGSRCFHRQLCIYSKPFWMIKFTPIKTLIEQHIEFQGIT